MLIDEPWLECGVENGSGNAPEEPAEHQNVQIREVLRDARTAVQNRVDQTVVAATAQIPTFTSF